MPLLAQEPNVYPPTLFDDPELCLEDRAWWVLHTKPRQEKALARQLLDAEVPFYLPLLEQKLVVRGRLLPCFLPLFSGYVFLFGRPAERMVALGTRRVVRSLDVEAQEGLRRDLAQIDRLLKSGLPVTAERRLYPGALVEIRVGALAGLKGRIIRDSGPARFVVQVDFIQQGAWVTLDDYALAAVTEEQ